MSEDLKLTTEIIELPPIKERIRNHMMDNFNTYPPQHAAETWAETIEARRRPLAQALGLPSVNSAVLISSQGAEAIPEEVSSQLKHLAIFIERNIWERDFLRKQGVDPDSKEIHGIDLSYHWHNLCWGAQISSSFEPARLSYTVNKNTFKLSRRIKKASVESQRAAFSALQGLDSTFSSWDLPEDESKPPAWNTYLPKVGDWLKSFMASILLTPDPVMVLRQAVGYRFSGSCHRPGGQYGYGPFYYASDRCTLVAFGYDHTPRPEAIYLEGADGRCLYYLDHSQTSRDLFNVQPHPWFVQSRVYGNLSSGALATARHYIEGQLRAHHGGLPKDIWRTSRASSVDFDGSSGECYLDTDHWTVYRLGVPANHEDCALNFFSQAECPQCGGSHYELSCCFSNSESTCYNCGCAVDEEDGFFDSDGDLWCESCWIEHNTTCERCGEWVPRDDAVYSRYEAYCLNCAERVLSRCERCGEMVHDDAARDVDSCGPETWCVDCADHAAFACDKCGELVDEANNDEGLCSDCAADYQHCSDCGKIVERCVIDNDGHCPDCSEEQDEDEDAADVA